MIPGQSLNMNKVMKEQMRQTIRISFFHWLWIQLTIWQSALTAVLPFLLNGLQAT